MPWLDEYQRHTCNTPRVYSVWNSGEVPKLGSLWQCGSCRTVWRLNGQVTTGEPSDREYRLFFIAQKEPIN